MAKYFIHPYKSLNTKHLDVFLKNHLHGRNMEDGKLPEADKETLDLVFFVLDLGLPAGFDMKMNKPSRKSDPMCFTKKSYVGDCSKDNVLGGFDLGNVNFPYKPNEKKYSFTDYMNSFSKLPDSFFEGIKNEAQDFIKTAAYYHDSNFKKISLN